MKKFLIIGLLWVGLAAFPAYASVIPRMNNHGAYILENASQLRWFRDAVNNGATELDAVLAADIDLEGHPWVPIGNSEKTRYNGSFDGQRHLIRGLNVRESRTLGLFGYIDYGSTVSNLRLEEAKIVFQGGGRIQAGVIAGASRGIIQNCCVIKSTLLVWRDGKTPAHISCGVIAGTNDEGVILDCVTIKNSLGTKTGDERKSGKTNLPEIGDTLEHKSEGGIGALQPDFYEYYAAGGVCGLNIATMPRVGVIMNCRPQHNEILISSGAHEVDFFGGGIVGWMLGGIIRQCDISGGKISSYSVAKNTEIGGIAGASSPGGYIEDSRVEGGMSLSSLNNAASSLGGAVGSMIGTNISSCLIKDVTIHAYEDGPYYLGGIAGVLVNGKISDCRVAVTFIPAEKSGFANVGAVAGMMSDLDELHACCPRPAVENTFFAAGIAGGTVIGAMVGMNAASADIAAFPFDLSLSPDLEM